MNKFFSILGRSVIPLILILMAGCNSNESDQSNSLVKYAGALKNILHKGDLSTKISLSELKNKPHLYALGAMTNLKGEIQIFDGVSNNSLVDNDSLVIDHTFSRDATLLVYAQVNVWDTIQIPPSIINRKELEEFISKEAKIKGISTTDPIPFLLEGPFKSIKWHVINWKEGDNEHSHEKHIESGLYGTLRNTDALMLGFYSKKHKGIFTHHTTNSHIHFKSNVNKISGHVDDIELSDAIVLMLPHTK